MSTARIKPAVLLILDGWGYSEQESSNAIKGASTPVWERLWNKYPHTLIGTSGAEVGLPAGQMGNSEVGHLNLGAGRVVHQEFTRVSHAVDSGSFFTNPRLTDAIDVAVKGGKAVHILGLLSPGGVHSHEEHIHAMVKLALERGAENVYVHAFLDGRDMPPKSAAPSLALMEQQFEQLGGGRIATIVGRFYAMDRDNRWERVEKAYHLLTLGESEYQADDAETALQMAYERGESDEFVKTTAVVPAGEIPVKVEDGDALVFLNYRSDRVRELTRTFIEADFDGFERKVVRQLGAVVSLTEYNETFGIPVAFPPERLDNVFGEYLSRLGLRQLRLAETEKYAHVTFFFNGGREEPFEGEDRQLIPSPRVATYDLQPEMSALEVTEKLEKAIESGRYDVIICNYANADMVGHTGDYQAAVAAIETIDRSLERVVSALLRSGGELLVTADHGNAELMRDEKNDQPHTAHTDNPVPLLYIGREAKLAENGALCDIAPSLLHIMGLEPPSEMDGHSLIEFAPGESDA
ncbi:MAG: 2,3-bisphosphoglycerate-independent phosphoglycerate mutase [Sedimenticola sp.]